MHTLHLTVTHALIAFGHFTPAIHSLCPALMPYRKEPHPPPALGCCCCDPVPNVEGCERPPAVAWLLGARRRAGAGCRVGGNRGAAG